MNIPDFEKLIDDEMLEKIIATMELVDGYRTPKTNLTFNWSMGNYTSIVKTIEIMGFDIENTDHCKKYLQLIIDFAYEYELANEE